MSYSCTDFTDSILDALNIELEDDEMDDPSAQADKALEALDSMRAAMRQALEALKALPSQSEQTRAAIERLEKCLA